MLYHTAIGVGAVILFHEDENVNMSIALGVHIN